MLNDLQDNGEPLVYKIYSYFVLYPHEMYAVLLKYPAEMWREDQSWGLNTAENAAFPSLERGNNMKPNGDKTACGGHHAWTGK